MATKVQKPQANGITPKKPAAPRAQVKKPAAKQLPNGVPRQAHQKAAPVPNKAASIAGENANGVTSAYAIMASRIANRVAEMAESITLVEKPKQGGAQPSEPEPEEKKKPRKLQMRLNSGQGNVSFSAPFIDNTLQKMLQLQNRMLKTTAELSKAEGVEESVVKEHAAQSAEMSRIIAEICAEKARQGA